MENTKFFIFFIITFLFAMNIGISQKFTVGVSPPLIDVGSMEPGSSKILSFFIITPSSEDIIVDLDAEDYGISIFDSGKFDNIKSEYSEQSSSEWVEFTKNPVLLKARDEKLETEGGYITGFREVTFVLRVPRDAEPGYHLIKIKPGPRMPSGPNSGAINIRTITPVTILFKVSGDAERDIKIMDITSASASSDRVVLDAYILNDGTVTASCIINKLAVFNSSGDQIASVKSGFETLEPNEMRTVKLYWYIEDMEPDIFPVTAILDYFTGTDFKEGTITYTGIPTGEAVKIPAEGAKMPSNLMVFIILLIIIIIAYLIYRWS
jgi:hypothetical protein